MPSVVGDPRPVVLFVMKDSTDNIMDLWGDGVSKSLNVNDWSYWKDQRFDWTSGNLDYKAFNATHKAATSDATWYIWKYTYSAGNLTRTEGPLEGSYDGRAALAWA